LLIGGSAFGGGPEFGGGPKSAGGPELGGGAEFPGRPELDGGPELGIAVSGPLPLVLTEGPSGIDTGPIEVGPVSVLGVDPPEMLSVLDVELLPGLPMLDDGLLIEGISIIEDDDDPESLGPIGDGPGSLGASGNDTGPAAATGSGNALAFATPAPIDIELNPKPVTITALTTRCFVVLKGLVVLKDPVVLTVRLPVHPSNAELYKPGLSRTCDFPPQPVSPQPVSPQPVSPQPVSPQPLSRGRSSRSAARTSLAETNTIAPRRSARMTGPVPGIASVNEPLQRRSVPPAAFGVKTASAR
jgi:hypothetical protein